MNKIKYLHEYTCKIITLLFRILIAINSKTVFVNKFSIKGFKFFANVVPKSCNSISDKNLVLERRSNLWFIIASKLKNNEYTWYTW